MALEEYDVDTFNGSIAAGGTEQLTVEISTAKYVVVYIDNGTTGSTPPEYTMTQDVYNQNFDDWQFYDEVTAETARSWEDIARGAEMRFTFENTSAASGTYRICVRSYKE